jgi:hypothetical protein
MTKDWIECPKCSTPRFIHREDLGYWLVDPTKHNPRIKVGERCRVPLDYEWEGISPFRGLEVTVDEISHYSYAGFDCTCRLHISAEELASRYTLVSGAEITEDEVYDWHFFDEEDGRSPGLYFEHETFNLDPIETRPAQNERVLLVLIMKEGTLGTTVNFTRQKNEYEVRHSGYRPSEASLIRLERAKYHGELIYLSSSCGRNYVQVEYVSKFNADHKRGIKNGF